MRHPEAYIISGNFKWWDGYDADEHVIMDDIRADSMRFNTLLGILDRYPCRVEFKGGTRQLLANVIIITCPLDHKALFCGELNENIDQLTRRIDWEWEVTS